MDGQKSEGQLSRSYCPQGLEQPDRHALRFERHRSGKWMQWVVAVLCIHAAVVLILWGAVWHNVSEQDATMIIELVSLGAQPEGETQEAQAGQTRLPQSPADSQQALVQPPPPQLPPQSAPTDPARAETAQRNDSHALDPFSSTDPAALAESVSQPVASELLDTQVKPELAKVPTPASAAPRIVRPKAVTPSVAPPVVKSLKPPEPASRTPSAKPSEPAGAPVSESSGRAPQGSSELSARASAVAADKSPAILSSPKPAYPRTAYRARQEGRVTIDIEVLGDGKVGRAMLQATSGVPSLDESALEAIRTWQYAPGSRAGQPTAQWIRVVVAFELKNR